MIPNEACHYTKAETTLLILRTKKLRIGQLKCTNDPRESKERYAGIINEVRESLPKDRFLDTKLMTKELNRIALEEWKVLCVTMHGRRKFSGHPQDVVYNQDVRPGYSHPRMWAQYAEKHKGACIVLDGIKLNENINKELGNRCKIFGGRVSYDYQQFAFDNVYYPQIEGYINKYGFTNGLRHYYFVNLKNIFLIKHPDWKQESEYRWLLHSPKHTCEYVAINNVLKGILLGLDFPKSSESELKRLCKELGIWTRRMVSHDGFQSPEFDSDYRP
jgi:Protein of unknown function (DUF2971)